MKTPIVLLVACSVLSSWFHPALNIGPTGGVAQRNESVIEREGVAEFTTKQQGHTAKIVFATRLFDARKHKIRRVGTCITIDGRRPLGTDCNMPQVEIASMKFFFDGKEIPVPARLYSDCYTPPPFKEYKKRGWVNKYLNVKLSDDLERVFVFLAAGDGAGVYDVIWVLSKDGRHTRFSNSGGDCSFLNFDCPPTRN